MYPNCQRLGVRDLNIIKMEILINMPNYSFSGRRIITKGIRKDLPISLIRYLWNLIDNLKKEADITMDYLQVFEINNTKKNNCSYLLITHIQEIPPYVKVYSMRGDLELSGRIYVIDGIDHVTMLWSHEY